MTIYVERLAQSDALPVESSRVVQQAILDDRRYLTFTMEDFREGHLGWLDDAELVVGQVPALVRALEHFGVEAPEPDYYPDCLREHLHRRVERTTLGEALEVAMHAPRFIKSVAWKRIAGQVFDPQADVGFEMTFEDPELPVWVAEVVKWQAEYRIYVCRDEIRGVCVYQGPDELDDKPPVIDLDVVRDAVSRLASSPEPRAAYSFDWGLLADGTTALVENNDAWAIGLYPGLSPRDYLEMLELRWRQMVGRGTTPRVRPQGEPPSGPE